LIRAAAGEPLIAMWKNGRTGAGAIGAAVGVKNFSFPLLHSALEFL